MVEATKTIVPILVDCTSAQANGDLKKKYGITGFPTVLFVDGEGNKVEELGSRAPEAVKGQILAVAAKYGVKVFEDLSLEDARKAAAERGKLLAILFLDESNPKFEPANLYLMSELVAKDAEEVRAQFVFVQRPLLEGGKPTDEAKAYGAPKASPVLLLVDPSVEDAKKSVVKKLTSGKKLVKELEKVANKASK